MFGVNMFSIWDSVVFPNNQNLPFELANSITFDPILLVLFFFFWMCQIPYKNVTQKMPCLFHHDQPKPLLPHTAQWCGNWSCLGLSIDEEWEKRATLDVRDRRREAPWRFQKSGQMIATFPAGWSPQMDPNGGIIVICPEKWDWKRLEIRITRPKFDMLPENLPATKGLVVSWPSSFTSKLLNFGGVSRHGHGSDRRYCTKRNSRIVDGPP